MDPLLQRQLHKHLHGRPVDDPAWLALLDAVSKTYEELEQDKKFLSHTLEVASIELTEANERLRRESESQLRRLNDYFEQTLDDQPNIIFRCHMQDGAFIVRLARGALLQRFGQAHETLEARDIAALVPQPTAREFFERAWRGADQRFELAYEKPSIKCQVLLHPSRQHGQVVEILGVITDITEAKTAADRLAASESFARETLDGLKSAIVILDEGGGIISSNSAWRAAAAARGFGAEAAALGVNYLDGFMADPKAPPAAAALVAGIRQVISGKRTDFTLEYAWHLPAQQQWFVCQVTRFSGQGQVRVVVSNQDNTQLRALQEVQNRSQRMESLGTLAGGIAHDLNNALAPIIMGGELLRVEDPQQSQMLATLQASARRAADMVRQLLTFAKGAEGVKTRLNARQLVAEMESIIKSTFPKNIDLQVELDQNLPMILGDATQLHQILLNLCVNARDAMPTGGRLTLEMKPVRVDAVYTAHQPDARPGSYLRLSVIDTGMGISPADLNHIFEPFFTTKAPNKGTGLGLSSVLGIVKGHGGFIQVYSELGRGSTFAVHLPEEPGDGNTTHMVRADTDFRGQGQSILLVDDEPPIRQIGCAVLEKLGFKPLAACDGMDGLMMATEHRADLSAVILDIDMPHMNGITLAQALRHLRSDLPVAAMSGRFSEATQAGLLEAGVTVHLGKPFTEAQLGDAMQKLLAPKPAT